ncbi:MAG: hypothetical protein LQ343_005599 [Gyalolechia ehrenbergii]|nr:MAG: hypothetical protein LQ343_005599 [Gyalolechia ehrenbergii]
MQPSSVMSVGHLMTLEEGHGDAITAQEPWGLTNVKTESTAVASSPTTTSKTKSIHLEDFPRGFPRLACFLDSDEAFMVYKRFGIVFSRLLLNKQDEIRHMENKLHAMDQADNVDDRRIYIMSRSEDVERHPQSITYSSSETRPELLRMLEKSLLEYSELLLKASQLKALDKPSSRDYRSVLRYMEKGGGQLFEEEMSWIYEKEDLVTLRPGREHAWLDGILERLLSLCRGKFVRVSVLIHGLQT